MNQDYWPTTRLSLLLQVKDPRAEEAWTYFVGQYRPFIVKLIQDVFPLDASEAEDVAQEVLLKLLRAMKQFEYDPQQKFRSWLRTITRNAVRDALRSRKTRKDRATGDTHVQSFLHGQASKSDEVADRMVGRLHYDLLADAEAHVKRRVEPRTWVAYTRSKTGEVRAREIAAETGMSVAAVYKAKSKVIRMIREEISRLTSSDGSKIANGDRE